MVSFYGDYDTTETVVIPFNSFTSDDPSASVTLTNLANTDIYIYKDGSLTQRTSSAGVAVDVDVDGIAGNHWVTIDLSDNTDAGFYVAGSRYQARMEGVTIDGAQINAWIGAWSVGCTLRPATAGRTVVVDAAGLVDANTVKSGPTGSGTAQTANDNGADINAILVDTGTTLDGRIPAALVSGRMSSDAVAISGDTTAADNLEAILDGTGIASDVDIQMRSLTITNDAGIGVAITGTTAGLDVNGTAGIGVDVDGTTHGVTADGANGNGLGATGGTNGHGIAATGQGSGKGLSAIAVGTGDGIFAQGGITSGSGGNFVGQGTNATGMACTGTGTEDGIKATGGATGRGLHALGGATSGAGVYAAAQNNNDAGMELVKNGTGSDLDAQLDLDDTKGTIDEAQLGADCITSSKIADDAISSEHLNTGAFTADAFAADALIAATFATGAFTADAFAANALAAATFAASSLDGKGDWNTTVPDAAGTAPTANEINAEVVDALQTDTPVDGKTITAALQIIAAACAGKISGAGTGTEVFVGLDAATTRATVTVDASGNRTAVSY